MLVDLVGERDSTAAAENYEVTGPVVQRLWIPAVGFTVPVHWTMVVVVAALIAPDAVPVYVAVQDDQRGEKCGDSFLENGASTG